MKRFVCLFASLALVACSSADDNPAAGDTAETDIAETDVVETDVVDPDTDDPDTVDPDTVETDTVETDTVTDTVETDTVTDTVETDTVTDTLEADTVAAETADGDATEPCEVRDVLSHLPGAGATEVYYRDAVKVTFDAASDDAALIVSRGDQTVEGAAAWDGTTLVFTPSLPFAPSTEYSVVVTLCDQRTASYSFTTSALGTPVALAEVALVGRSYLLDLQSGVYEPAVLGQILNVILDQRVLVSVEAVDTDAGTITFAANRGWKWPGDPPEFAVSTEDGSFNGIVQMCEATTLFPDSVTFVGNPYFATGAVDMQMSAGAYVVDVTDLRISGNFMADGSRLAEIVVGARFDTRPMVPYLFDDCGGEGQEPCDPAAICELFARADVACEPCAKDSTAITCSNVEGEDACCLSFHARSIPGLPLVDAAHELWRPLITTAPGDPAGHGGAGTLDSAIDPCETTTLNCSAATCEP